MTPAAEGTRTERVQEVADAIRRALADGEWHKAIGIPDWTTPPGLVGDALNLLLREEVIEEDTRRRVYRLRPVHAAQTTIYDQEVT